MATKQFYATGDFRYGTRMLRAGDGPIAMTGPQARLYTALGKISPHAPKKVATAPVAPVAPPPAAPIAAKRKPATRKKAAKKAK